MNETVQWWAAVYVRQHQIWPNWSNNEGNAQDIAMFLTLLNDKNIGRVLDLGCGVGRELCALATLGWRGIGIDTSQLIELAKARAIRLGVEDLVDFNSGDILVDPPAYEPVDLLLAWDSTLAIWPVETQLDILRRWSASLVKGGIVVIGQLAFEHFRYKKEEKVTMVSDDIGPGRTVRTYNWDETEEILQDNVVWYPPDGNTPENLPTQCLHLLSGPQLYALLEKSGLINIEVFGSDGWNWTLPGRRPPDKLSNQVIAMGRKP